MSINYDIIRTTDSPMELSKHELPVISVTIWPFHGATINRDIHCNYSGTLLKNATTIQNKLNDLQELLTSNECRILWGEREQAACILATEKVSSMQKTKAKSTRKEGMNSYAICARPS